MSDKYAIISDAVPQICEELLKRSYKLIYTDCVDGFISYEQKHADMQCIAVNNAVYVLKECERLINDIKSKCDLNIIKTTADISGKYPHNVLLNAKIIGNYLIGKIDSLDKSLVNNCLEAGYNLINVNQGYAGCSCLKVDDNSLITTDESIYKALENINFDVLKISNENISLFGAKRGECGFIGGASVNLGNEILFFGDISKHPEFQNIKHFCTARNVKISYIESIPLTDIGGVVLLNN